jgi:hypothetical protein
LPVGFRQDLTWSQKRLISASFQSCKNAALLERTRITGKLSKHHAFGPTLGSGTMELPRTQLGNVRALPRTTHNRLRVCCNLAPGNSPPERSSNPGQSSPQLSVEDGEAAQQAKFRRLLQTTVEVAEPAAVPTARARTWPTFSHNTHQLDRLWTDLRE